ncbi:uncharacterized protein LOC133736017 [Rosa rugosa]|uniref:uncharacterized protein LOC133736017 n=1 Tax=Rosa rugosa TaxID=74645 RepID=UPI002B4115E1|nr:uncharacterized protein LOC133736017 [Rosa rugosa]
MERFGKYKISFVERPNKITFSSIESERRLATTVESLVKLTLKEDEEPITLQVQNQNHGDIYYRTGRTVSLGNILKDYCERKGLVYGEMRFIYDGKRVRSTHTPQQLEMEDDFVIDAMSEQIGG